MVIKSYITFNGNCKQAMLFYKKCLGGDLHFQTVGDSPLTENLPEPMKHYILQATLALDNTIIMGTDMVPEEGLKRGNSISLFLDCDDIDTMHHVYNRLIKGGVATQPIATTLWGDLHGELIDQFGIQWLLHFSPGYFWES